MADPASSPAKSDTGRSRRSKFRWNILRNHPLQQKESNNGEKIDIADGLGLRLDKANLVVAIENVWGGGKALPYNKITIAKNSLGRTDYFYLHDAPGGNHLQFQLEGQGIADRAIVEGLIYQAKQELLETHYPQTPK